MASLQGAIPTPRFVFNKYDKDKNGSLDRTEFRNMVTKQKVLIIFSMSFFEWLCYSFQCYEFGHYLSDEQLTIAIAQFDKNGNTLIEYSEFLEWWSHGEVRYLIDLTLTGC